jgi:hypothetical protein
MVETKSTLAKSRADEQSLSHEEQKVLAEVLAAIRAIRHGHVHLTVQDARVIQIDRTEKHRLV